MQEFHSPLKAFSSGGSARAFKLEFWMRYESLENLKLVYRLVGPLSDLIIPHPSAQAQARDFLWEHMCFEFFVGWDAEDTSRYWEWNFSPSGEWMVYGFSEYRKADRSFSTSLEYDVQFMKHSATELSLEVDVPLLNIIPKPGSGSLRAAACAVIEHKTNKEKTYWALKHTESKPNFHRRESFSIELVKAI